MTENSFTFSEQEHEIAAEAMRQNPSIGISALATQIGRSKDAAKALRHALAEQLPQADLMRSHPGELDFGLDRLFPHPFNTRIVEEEDRDIAALADAIALNGQVEPLVAVRASDCRTEALVIDGVRRLAALRRLKRTTARIVLVDLPPEKIAATISSRDRMQKRWSAYEFAVHLDKVVVAYGTEKACADAMRMSADAFSKARAPAQLPDCVIEKIADLRKISGKDAAKLRAEWNRDSGAVQAAMAGIKDKAPAKEVMGILAGSTPPQRSELITVSRVRLEQALGAASNNGEAIPAALNDLISELLSEGRSIGSDQGNEPPR